MWKDFEDACWDFFGVALDMMGGGVSGLGGWRRWGRMAPGGSSVRCVAGSDAIHETSFRVTFGMALVTTRGLD